MSVSRPADHVQPLGVEILEHPPIPVSVPTYDRPLARDAGGAS